MYAQGRVGDETHILNDCREWEEKWVVHTSYKKKWRTRRTGKTKKKVQRIQKHGNLFLSVYAPGEQLSLEWMGCYLGIQYLFIFLYICWGNEKLSREDEAADRAKKRCVHQTKGWLCSISWFHGITLDTWWRSHGKQFKNVPAKEEEEDY